MDTPTLEALQKENEAFKQKELDKLKQQYQIFQKIIQEISGTGYLVHDQFEKFLEDLKNNAVFIELGKVNNPSSEILGFKFVDKIEEAALESFLESLDDTDKERFKQAISNAIHNPILKAVIESNPVTSIVSKVVDTVINFAKTFKFRKKIFLDTEKAFRRERVRKFVDNIKPYMDFYTALVKTATNYDKSVNQLADRKSRLQEKLDNRINQFLKLLDIPTESSKNYIEIMNRVRDKFVDLPNGTAEDYAAILDNEDYQQAKDIALDFPALKESTTQLQQEYYSILSAFYKQNLEALSTAKELKDKAGQPIVDLAKVESLEKKINQSIDGLNKKIADLVS